MILALALNDFTLLNLVYTSIPYKCIYVVVLSTPPSLVPALLNFLRVCLCDVTKRQSTSTPKLPETQRHSILPVGGSPHLQYHLRWLTCLFSSHTTILQQFDGGWVPKIDEEKKNCDQLAQNTMNQCGKLYKCVFWVHQLIFLSCTDPGISVNDLRILCLLLLRNIQRVHFNLSLSFGSNLRSLDFILSSTTRPC